MRHIRFLPAISVSLLLLISTASAGEPLKIGSRVEPLVDDYLIAKLDGDAALYLHKPVPGEVVLVTDKPWEGNTCAYYTVFQDGDLYRMYYRGSHFDEQTRKSGHPEVACYAESTDGIDWTKPELGLFDFNGSNRNNIIWTGTHNFTPFKDNNPDCPEDARYKALGGAKGGLIAFKSADGIRWSLISEDPVITKGAFDSQNLAFWDSHAGVYREYHRTFRGVRDIQTGTSSDFLQWTDPVFLEYPGVPLEHLYTNAIQPCPRAPHLLIGFPTRYHPERGQQVEPTFMTSRDGRVFHRWTEALIPVTAPENRDGNRSNYMAWGVVQLPDRPREYSVYATEAYYTGPDSRIRRFTYRVDGFVSVRASGGGELLTKPLQFSGGTLVVNCATREQGSVLVELQDAGGQPIEGFSLADCTAFRGDEIAHTVSWRGGSDVSTLAGQSIRLRFQLKNADLFSLQFVP